MIHGNLKKLFAGLLAAVMVVTSMPLSAYATEDTAFERETEEGQGSESAETSEEAAHEERIEDAWTDNVQSSDGETETGTEEIGEERHTDENSTDVDQTYIPTDEAQDSLEESLTEVFEEEETRTEAEEEAEKDIDVRGTETIAQLKQRFPAGKYWNRVNLSYNNPDGVTDTPCPSNHDKAPNTCNDYRRYAQCWGFAYRLAYGYYGSCPLDSGWSQSTNAASLDSLKAGDIIRYLNNGHTIWVTGVDGDKITFADCNSDYHCGIRWDAVTYKSTVKSTFTHLWSAPYAAVESSEPEGTDLPNGGSRTIMDGDYHIITGVDNSMGLDIDSISTQDGANAQIWHSIDEPKQVFTVKWLGADKGYKIIHKYSGKSLDVEGASKKRGANVRQWGYILGGLQHQWVIDEVDNGAYYTIRSRCGGFYLDVEGGGTTNGTNVRMWEGNGSNAQKWRFIPAGEQTIPNGDYYIMTDVKDNMCLDILNGSTVNDASAVISSKTGRRSQIFTVSYLNNGFYKIINKNSNRSLSVYHDLATRGTNVIQYGYDGGKAQQWTIIREAGGDSYYIQPRCSGHYLDVANGQTAENTNVWTTVWMQGAAVQKWKFIPYEKPKLNPPTPSIASGTQVEKGTKLTLTCPGADKIYYTTDGIQPTTQSTQYSTQGITINTDMTLKTFAVKEGYRDSDIVTYTYTVKQPEPSSEKESSSSVESSSSEENPSDVESGADKESAATEESSATPEDTSAAEDIEDDIKWNYDEAKVTYKDLSESGAKITTNIRPKIYDGTPYRPVVKVTAAENGKTITLTEGADYRVAYAANIHAGRGKVTVYGNGIYKGKISAEFEIRKKPLKKLKVVTDGMIAGDTSKPKVYVYDGSALLKEGKDYTLDGVSEDLAASKGKKKIYIMAAPSSDYEGFTAAAVTVYDAKGGRIQGVISSPDAVQLSQTAYPYTGQACTPTAAVTVNGQPLTAGRDYTIKYQNNKEAGTAFAIITGKGAYAGSVVKEFTIKASDGEFILKNPIKPAVYNGRLQKPKLTVTSGGKTLKQNKDYTITYADNLHATDRAKAIVRGKGSYAGIPAKTFYFTITPCNIKKASVKTIQGKLTLTYAKHTLVEGVDYVLTYGSPDSKGRITVTIKAKEGSSFTGEITKMVKQ